MSSTGFFDTIYEKAESKFREQCLQTYTEMSSIIPDSLFQKYHAVIRPSASAESDEVVKNDLGFAAFDANPELRALSSRTKRLIYLDVPRTFGEFAEKSAEARSFLKNEERYSALLLVLCRVLCAACKMFSTEYRQGMNFAAGAVVLNCTMKVSEAAAAQQANSDSSPIAAITACFNDLGSHDSSYHISFDTEMKSFLAVCQLLSSDSLLPLLKGSGQLFAQVKRFEYVISRFLATTRVVSHLENLGTSLDFLTNPWLSACFTTGVPHKLSIVVQEMILEKLEHEVILRVGLSIISILQARILQLRDPNLIVDEIKAMALQLNVNEVLHYVSHFRVDTGSSGIVELVEPPDRSRIPLALGDAAVSEAQLREIRATYRLHTTSQWIRGNIDDEFREHVGSFYSSLLEANLPPPRLFSPNKSSAPDKQSITEWSDGHKNDALSVWDVRELPAASVRGDSGPPSNAEHDFYEHSLLIDILPRHKRGIYVDVPRTFSEFEQKSDVIAKYLALPANKDRMLQALCRMLCVACKLHRSGYCQGMNYIAASVLLNCVCETDPEETGDALEIKACQLFCHLLTCQNIIDWFRESQILSKELDKLNFILMHHVPTALATQYLDQSGFSTQVWAMEWFTTCCTVGAPRELGLLVQNMLLDGKETDVIFKVGAAMTAICQDKILQLKDTNSLLKNLRDMLRNLDSNEVLRLTLRYRLNDEIINRRTRPHGQVSSTSSAAPAGMTSKVGNDGCAIS